MISRDEFVSRYGEAAELMAEWGELALPCDCGWEECQGWQYYGRETADDYRAMGHFTDEQIDEAVAYADRVLQRVPEPT